MMDRSPLLAAGTMRGATLVGIALLIVLGYMNWDQTRRIQDSLDQRLGEIETRLTQISAKVDQRPAAQRQARRGPDPNKVYTVKTENAPYKGPKSAPITIVEFSDFQ